MSEGALIKRIRTDGGPEGSVGSSSQPITIEGMNHSVGTGGLFTNDVANLRQRRLAEARNAKLGKPNSIPLWLQFVSEDKQLAWRSGLPVSMSDMEKAKYDNFKSAVIFPSKKTRKKRVVRRKTTTRRKKAAPRRRRAAPRSRAMPAGVTIVKG